MFDLFPLNIFGERQWTFSYINVRQMNLIEIVVECRTQEEAALIIQSQVIKLVCCKDMLYRPMDLDLLLKRLICCKQTCCYSEKLWPILI